MRAAGILLHISSLPSDYGIGTFGQEAYKFVDFLKNSGIRYWQVLPLGHTGFGDSPYQSFSTFAGNPYFIDFDILIKKGFLTYDDLSRLTGYENATSVDYGKIYSDRFNILKIAFAKFKLSPDNNFVDFCRNEAHWLNDYAIYMSIHSQTQSSWHCWGDGLKKRLPEYISAFAENNAEEIEFWKFVQYEFFTQWNALKRYANENGVKIIGDLPIYVSDDSADVWANPTLFDLDENLNAVNVAGVPPDAFSSDGQLWGNPVYKWENHKKSDYTWWKNRFDAAFKMYDVVRIDHFRGFESFYSIPAGSPTAAYGKWLPGPGIEFFRALNLTDKDNFKIIAEDLGIITPEVKKLLNDCGYAGMKILQFAFNADIYSNDGGYLPHSIPENSIVYSGTHDNLPTARWWQNESEENRKFCLEYAGWDNADNICDKIIGMAFATAAKLAIIPMQDWLSLGEESRMNCPSTKEGNWQWRMKKDDISPALAQKILRKVQIYRR